MTGVGHGAMWDGGPSKGRYRRADLRRRAGVGDKLILAHARSPSMECGQLSRATSVCFSVYNPPLRVGLPLPGTHYMTASAR